MANNDKELKESSASSIDKIIKESNSMIQQLANSTSSGKADRNAKQSFAAANVKNAMELDKNLLAYLDNVPLAWKQIGASSLSKQLGQNNLGGIHLAAINMIVTESGMTKTNWRFILKNCQNVSNVTLAKAKEARTNPNNSTMFPAMFYGVSAIQAFQWEMRNLKLTMKDSQYSTAFCANPAYIASPAISNGTAIDAAKRRKAALICNSMFEYCANALENNKGINWNTALKEAISNAKQAFNSSGSLKSGYGMFKMALNKRRKALRDQGSYDKTDIKANNNFTNIESLMYDQADDDDMFIESLANAGSDEVTKIAHVNLNNNLIEGEDDDEFLATGNKPESGSEPTEEPKTEFNDYNQWANKVAATIKTIKSFPKDYDEDKVRKQMDNKKLIFNQIDVDQAAWFTKTTFNK
jgi:hypothetical protein